MSEHSLAKKRACVEFVADLFQYRSLVAHKPFIVWVVCIKLNEYLVLQSAQEVFEQQNTVWYFGSILFLLQMLNEIMLMRLVGFNFRVSSDSN